ncbi:MAG: substrate-binding domain-containing protein [Phycisphaerae bacterium]|nr:substrate-binding domain-containing protein [Phycisphaerae bacterium]
MRITRTYKSVVVLVILSALLITGCSKDKTESEDNELIVLCGSSFSNPMNELCSQFTEQTGIKFATTVSGSENHLPLIKTAHEGDIFVTHDPYLDYVRDANFLSDYVHVGYVSPVLAVQPGNPKKISSIQDLTRPGLKVALSNPEYSTCGEMVFALLEKKGIKDAVMKNVENRLLKGHPELCNLLKTKTVDAIITWNGVAHTFRDSVEIVPTPYEYDKERRVHIIGLNYSKHPDLLKQFLEFARKRGEAVFKKHGYVK